RGGGEGGGEAVMAAQRFPDDYDGITAGALANRHIYMHTAGSARQIVLARHPDMAISPEKAQIVNDAVMKACDTLHEGFLNNPQQCTFSFASLVCRGAESNECLTSSQLRAVDMFYGGLKNSKGEVIFAGQAIGNPLPPQR